MACSDGKDEHSFTNKTQKAGYANSLSKLVHGS